MDFGFLFGLTYVWSRSRRYHSRSWPAFPPPPNENADDNFAVVEMRRLKTVQNNFYLIGESGIQLQIFAKSKRHVFQHLLIS